MNNKFYNAALLRAIARRLADGNLILWKFTAIVKYAKEVYNFTAVSQPSLLVDR